MKFKCKNCKELYHSRTENKHKLCRRCYINNANKKQTIKKRKNHLCFDCGKEVKPDRCSNCNEIIGYKRRCKKCIIKINKRKKKNGKKVSKLQ